MILSWGWKWNIARGNWSTHADVMTFLLNNFNSNNSSSSKSEFSFHDHIEIDCEFLKDDSCFLDTRGICMKFWWGAVFYLRWMPASQPAPSHPNLTARRATRHRNQPIFTQTFRHRGRAIFSKTTQIYLNLLINWTVFFLWIVWYFSLYRMFTNFTLSIDFHFLNCDFLKSEYFHCYNWFSLNC